jgi:isopropylmalate/homocitrate/citramalate synthase
MTDFPKRVEFHEEGPREGFQIEPRSYPIEQRARLIDMLAASGLRRVQVGSFVSPKNVPTMADTEDLFEILPRRPGVRYTALWLNEKGFEKARTVPGLDLEPNLMLYASDAFSRANNNRSMIEMRDQQAGWLDRYERAGLSVAKAYVMTAFGCNLQGEVPLPVVTDLFRWVIDLFRGRGLALPALILADTVGRGNPEEIKRRIGAVRDMAPDARIGLHLHDTRGLGSANVYAALQMGVDLFDSSVAGLGGCPFAGHSNNVAAGNVCTEDMVYLCRELGIETGIDLAALVEAARFAEQMIGRTLNGRVMHTRV